MRFRPLTVITIGSGTNIYTAATLSSPLKKENTNVGVVLGLQMNKKYTSP